MRRRQFITLLGGAAAWPVAAHAQQQAMPVIGFLGSGSADIYAERLIEIRRGLSETGFVEGRNVVVEYRWAEGRLDQLPALAADLVSRNVSLMVASGGSPAPAAAKDATTTIPIVFTTDGDPVKDGVVASLNRPGGNATGMTTLTASLIAKRLEIFRDVMPSADTIGMFVNPTSIQMPKQVREAEEAGRALGQNIRVANVSKEGDLELALAALAHMGVAALVVAADPQFNAWRQQIVMLAHRHGIPAMYGRREFVAEGGLMSYGANLNEQYRQVGVYVGRILNGAQPADLPVLQPTRFELVVNLKTAKALGLTISESFLLRADEVIE
jgi:putative ABC transport system substrate-binding protein